MKEKKNYAQLKQRSRKQELTKFLNLFHQIQPVCPEHIMHNEIYRVETGALNATTKRAEIILRGHGMPLCVSKRDGKIIMVHAA